LEHNPSIGQISASSNKAAGLQTQVGLKPNPVIGYDATQIADGDNAGQQGAFVSQTFVRGDKLEANRRVLEQDYQSILWEVEVQRYRVQTDVRTRFYETLAAQTRLELATEFREVAKKGRQIAQDRLDAQEGALPDLLQAEIQLSEIDIIQQQAEVAYEAAWNELVTIVGLPEMRPVPLAGELPALVEERSFETLYQQLLESSPELQAAYARAERARANVQRQELQAIPNITGELGVGRNTMTGSGYANINIALPLPIRNRNEGNIQAACADYSRALLDAQRIELSIRSRLVRTLRDFDQARVSVHQFSTVILPKARQNMELSQQAHVAGEFDFLRVLIARRTFFETNLSYLNSRVELAQAEARLDGMLLTGGLDEPATYDRDDSLRGQSLSGE
ncbi:MAG TPA: TolC family protein, partial [Planctomycetaceae bacterium]|nr:TolC family protein [Planctomycetaceae bacterium]